MIPFLKWAGIEWALGVVFTVRCSISESGFNEDGL
jgi:hypothetical protein